MNKVQKTVAQWVQRIVSKTKSSAPIGAGREPVELDPQALRQVSGGTSNLPVKGW